MTSSAVSFVKDSDAVDALLVTAHPWRWAAMKLKAWSAAISLVMFGITMLTFAGCAGLRSGELSDEELEQRNEAKQRESHYWPAFKPDRSLQDPLWTP